MEMNSETISNTNLYVGAILRSPMSQTIHFVVEAIVTEDGKQYVDGKFVSDTDGSVCAIVGNCIIGKEWEVVGTSDEYEDDEDYEGRYIDDYSDDAEALASAGWGTDEDYGFYGDDY